ncbi:MAG TPA: urea carboxylase-associated family protein [Candidatus Gallacutalibacter stercoravium]|nr:urea carboxylase-associated family protein [Candidatus Gallacutalibacter stercoravium]
MRKEYLIPACSGMKIDVQQGQTITVIDIEGGQVADFFAEVIDQEAEFLSTGVTIDCNESLKLHVGNIIYTNLYRPMMQVLADDVGEHDLLHPCCRPEMYDFFYHNGDGHPNCLDNINRALGKRRATITPINLFMNTKIHQDGSISVEAPLSKAGDKIMLKALLDMTLGIAACSVSESKCNNGKCTSIGVIIE